MKGSRDLMEVLSPPNRLPATAGSGAPDPDRGTTILCLRLRVASRLVDPELHEKFGVDKTS
jgi:hypothetical protein